MRGLLRYFEGPLEGPREELARCIIANNAVWGFMKKLKKHSFFYKTHRFRVFFHFFE